MDWTVVISIITSVLSIALAFVGYYFDVKAKISEKAVGLIDDCEQDGTCGADKMALVVTELYKLVPAFFKPILNKKTLERIVQALFDKIEEYAEKQKNKVK